MRKYLKCFILWFQRTDEKFTIRKFARNVKDFLNMEGNSWKTVCIYWCYPENKTHNSNHREESPTTIYIGN